MLADSDLPLFNWTPPNEETPEKFKRAPDDPRDFTAEWLAFVRKNPAVADRIYNAAIIAWQWGARRISMDDLFNAERKAHGTELNNDHRAAASRWAIGIEPGLNSAIRTRRTTRTR